eukprot:CAMPEP_0183385330 /NCGR_PEP_ID=MMETSP0370-20130417/1351_1 /TAXON_ID=268820 /ORGANISM="Peridinium aciculiferum, Strain PAER-2" /LENGTH=82 /DNA_ID=CAMNT_0025563311 /DNA_START=188 /DNA_END=436 /DNA_ORIENTATION=-
MPEEDCPQRPHGPRGYMQKVKPPLQGLHALLAWRSGLHDAVADLGGDVSRCTCAVWQEHRRSLGFRGDVAQRLEVLGNEQQL